VNVIRHIALIAVCSIAGALAFASVMAIMPGLFPILLLFVCWWEKGPEPDPWDTGLRALLNEAQ
jgi:hypothetical protein